MKGTENVQKDFVNDFKAKNHADRVADPVQVKIRSVVMPQVSGKDHGKDQNLRDYVNKEKFEFLVQLAAEHHRGNGHLQQWVRYPESVIEDRDFFAHRNITLGSVRHGTSSSMTLRRLSQS